jgi:F-type H+-transporting ATPase subunit epsilon
MASTVQFDLVSPERGSTSFSAPKVPTPGADGDMTAMAGHAATITSLRPGMLRVVADAGAKSFVVTGGFAEITAAGVSVLAERAVPVEEMTAALLDGMVAEVTGAASADKDSADKAVADFAAIRAAVGL